MISAAQVNWDQVRDFSTQVDQVLGHRRALSPDEWTNLIHHMESFDESTQAYAFEHLVLFAPASGDTAKLAKYSEDQERDDHGRFSIENDVEYSPTNFLVRMELKELPAHHLDGLSKVQFKESEWIRCQTARGILDASGTYQPETRVITISSNKDNVHVYGGNTVAHEVGHHVHFCKLTDAAAKEWTEYSEKGQAARISAYARTNQGEHFAEAYRAYFRGGSARAALKNIEPRAYKFMASLNKAGSSRMVGDGHLAPIQWGRYS